VVRSKEGPSPPGLSYKSKIAKTFKKDVIGPNSMEDRQAAIKSYNKLKEKYELPELSEVEKEFDFELEDTAGIVKAIINQIWERISSMKSYIEGVLNPQRYCCMIETKFLKSKEKEKIFNFYKKIMIEYWKTVKATFEEEEAKINQLKNSYKFYQKVKRFSRDYIQRMIDGWSEEKTEEKQKDYIN